MPHAIRIERDVAMETRDGTVLRADVVRPETPKPVPALVCRTPYDKSLRLGTFGHVRALDAASAGFAVVFQDIRGRFASEGRWEAMAWDTVERDDGYDTVEWVAAEPWCDGRVGMIGGSYEGLNALAAAAARPPALGAIAPALLGAADARKTSMMLEGVMLSWAALVAMDVLERRRREGALDPSDVAKAMGTLADPARAARTLPLAELPPFTLPGMPTYEELAERLVRASASITDAVGAIEVPALWTTGWWDHGGGSDLYRAMRVRAASATAREETRLIVGPWSHTQHDCSLGDLGFGQLASLTSAQVSAAHLGFFARHLRGEDARTGSRVRFFLTGANVWQTAGDWPPPEAEEEAWSLGSERSARSVRGDGWLAAGERRGGTAADTYLADPDDPVPAIGWRALNLGGSTIAGPLDQSRVESRDDVLVYSSPALPEMLEVTGDPEVRLWVSTSARDADFMVKLCDVDPSGVSRNVGDGFVRLRWRESATKPVETTPGDVVALTIPLGFVGHAFRAGHRVRLQVASSAFPHVDRNRNTGAPVATDTGRVVAAQRVFHDERFPSALRLPVRRRTQRKEDRER